MSAAPQLLWLGAGDLRRVCPGGVGLAWVFDDVVAAEVPVGVGGAALDDADPDAVGEGSDGALCPGDPPGVVDRAAVR